MDFQPSHHNILAMEELKEEMLSSKYDNPRINANHITNHATDVKPNAMVKFANGVTDSTLIIYVHRQESDGLVSAINQAAGRYCQEFWI